MRPPSFASCDAIIAGLPERPLVASRSAGLWLGAGSTARESCSANSVGGTAASPPRLARASRTGPDGPNLLTAKPRPPCALSRARRSTAGVPVIDSARSRSRLGLAGIFRATGDTPSGSGVARIPRLAIVARDSSSRSAGIATDRSGSTSASSTRTLTSSLTHSVADPFSHAIVSPPGLAIAPTSARAARAAARRGSPELSAPALRCGLTPVLMTRGSPPFSKPIWAYALGPRRSPPASPPAWSGAA